MRDLLLSKPNDNENAHPPLLEQQSARYQVSNQSLQKPANALFKCYQLNEILLVRWRKNQQPSFTLDSSCFESKRKFSEIDVGRITGVASASLAISG
uniref:Uncharacterized protein n=1 Tax=Salix viminalis TaxID=40686 RepID=A0A6N2MA33_SALVM